MVKCLPEFEFFYCILENRLFISKIKRSKVTEYPALINWCQEKRTSWHVRPSKTQIILRIRAVWSESLMTTVWGIKGPTFLSMRKNKTIEDLDQPAHPHSLIRVRKRAQIRNRYNQAPHLTQAAIWVDKGPPVLSGRNTKTLIRLCGCTDWFKSSHYSYAKVSFLLDTCSYGDG